MFPTRGRPAICDILDRPRPKAIPPCSYDSDRLRDPVQIHRAAAGTRACGYRELSLRFADSRRLCVGMAVHWEQWHSIAGERVQWHKWQVVLAEVWQDGILRVQKVQVVDPDCSPNDTTTTSLPVNDASRPPNNASPYVFSGDNGDNSSGNLVELSSVNPDPLSAFDDACTGSNNTILSEHLYASQEQAAAGKAPTALISCGSGATPQTIQNATEWQRVGCYDGFYCKSAVFTRALDQDR